MKKIVSLLIAAMTLSSAPLFAETPSSTPTPAASATPSADASATPVKHKRKKKADASASVSPAAAESTSTKAVTTGTPAASPSPKHSWFKKKDATAEASPGTSPTGATTTSKKPLVPAGTPAPGGGPGLVWVNTESHVYHKQTSKWYGKTKKGKYMSEADALKEGDHAAKSEK